MKPSFENQTWIIDAGDSVIQKKSVSGIDSLTSIERLIYCLWVADYGMCNAGDLRTAKDVCVSFKEDAEKLSKDLGLNYTHETFSLSLQVLESEYFARFDRVCSELKSIEPSLGV